MNSTTAYQELSVTIAQTTASLIATLGVLLIAYLQRKLGQRQRHTHDSVQRIHDHIQKLSA
jgi:flagellar biogenesis protein FliO